MYTVTISQIKPGSVAPDVAIEIYRQTIEPEQFDLQAIIGVVNRKKRKPRERKVKVQP